MWILYLSLNSNSLIHSVLSSHLRGFLLGYCLQDRGRYWYSHHHPLRVRWVHGLMFSSRVGLLRWCCWSQLFHMLFWSFHRGFFFDIAIKVAFKCFYKKGVIVAQVHENGMCVNKSYNKRSVSLIQYLDSLRIVQLLKSGWKL